MLVLVAAPGVRAGRAICTFSGNCSQRRPAVHALTLLLLLLLRTAGNVVDGAGGARVSDCDAQVVVWCVCCKVR